MKIQDLINEKNHYAIDYYSYVKKYDKDILFRKSDINVFIPKFNRDKQFQATVRALTKAKQQCPDTNINIICIEEGEQPIKSEHLEISTIFRKKEGNFNKSLCFNIGYHICPKANWCVFHDSDILVPDNFFVRILEESQKTMSSWIQPYKNKRVLYVSDKYTDYVYSTNKPDLNVLKSEAVPGYEGAPGGTIVVKSSEFEAVGGYDPELFYEYSHEDSFFWSKLEINNQRLHRIKNCHQGQAHYINDIDVFHLYHPPNTNKRPPQSFEYLQCLWEEDYKKKMEYIEVAREVFKYKEPKKQ